MHTTVNDLIGRIYDAALSPEIWQDVIVEIRELTDSIGVHLGRGVVGRGIELLGFSYERATPALLFETMAGVGQEDLHFLNQHKTEEGVAILGPEFVPLEEHLRSRFYKEIGEQVGMCHSAGAILVRQEEFLALLTLWRSEEQIAYSTQEKELLQLLTPHMRRALILGDSMAVQRGNAELMAEIINALDARVIVLSESGVIQTANVAARNFLSNNPFLADVNGKLSVGPDGDGAALKKFISHAFSELKPDDSPSRLHITKPNSDTVTTLSAFPKALYIQRPLNVTTEEKLLICVLNGSENNASKLPNDVLTAVFGLTGAEISLARALVAGVSLPNYCIEKSISQNTARTHLKAIFSKVGVHSQIELIRKLNSMC